MPAAFVCNYHTANTPVRPMSRSSVSALVIFRTSPGVLATRLTTTRGLNRRLMQSIRNELTRQRMQQRYAVLRWPLATNAVPTSVPRMTSVVSLLPSPEATGPAEPIV